MAGKRKFLDGKLCFELWVQRSSLGKASNVLRDEFGIVNPSTGEKASTMGVWGAAWTYILNTLVEGRKGVESVWKANGELLTDLDWYTLVVTKARYIFGKKKFQKFIEKNSYLTPYL
ncbi:MAG: hypothetical protein US52_C0042G0003 [candidate division WS6 bacterium GW2011_GWA2_37_6]|uniref:Uncharacterized protein n=1 Tax=candidate division WS6 bacterium GW2011_GWA2_37_6 TaxID=1619087 RepID=A0A0G0GXY1_9BACT|nr:MAG: hypothetical protein US52_C0042G0003 [candidate division WS6 bacterium GW2011_GWA2_37_6]